MTRGRRPTTKALPVILGLGIAPGPAAAHGGETTGVHDAPLAVGLFCLGIVLVGASLYADERSEVDRKYVDAGVVLGFLAVVLGIPAYWL